jgi:large subunit ribosomal protein L24
MVICPHCDKPTRVGHREQPESASSRDKHIRVCKQCGETIDVEDRRA